MVVNGLPVPDKSLYFVCRMCSRMAEQWAQGQKVCQLKCGGPKKGLAYPMYHGPMTGNYLKSHCFVCGSPAEMEITVNPDGVTPDVQKLGICHRHLIHVGVDPEQVKGAPKPEADQIGVVQETRIVKVPLYNMLGIDPQKDLGFQAPEEKTDASQG